MKIDITNTPLFEQLLEYETDGLYFDLHNDYECKKISNKNSSNIEFVFKPIIQTKETIRLTFHSAVVVESTYVINDLQKTVTLDNFHRGRILQENKELVDKTLTDEKCYYLEFYEGQTIQILAQKVSFSVLLSNKMNKTIINNKSWQYNKQYPQAFVH